MNYQLKNPKDKYQKMTSFNIFAVNFTVNIWKKSIFLDSRFVWSTSAGNLECCALAQHILTFKQTLAFTACSDDMMHFSNGFNCKSNAFKILQFTTISSYLVHKCSVEKLLLKIQKNHRNNSWQIPLYEKTQTNSLYKTSAKDIWLLVVSQLIVVLCRRASINTICIRLFNNL